MASICRIEMEENTMLPSFINLNVQEEPEWLRNIHEDYAMSVKERLIDIAFHRKQPAPNGRPPIHVKFPMLVHVIRTYVTEHGFAAHEKRRETTGSVGVSLKQIQEHCFKTVPGLKDHGMSLNTVHRLFAPPNRKMNSSRYYKELIPAKVATKSNNISRNHIDSHYCRNQVKMALELINEYEDEVIGLSADAKAKPNLSGAAVSRMVRARSFMLTSDRITLSDHDFPEPATN